MFLFAFAGLGESGAIRIRHGGFLGYTYKAGTWHRVYARIRNTSDRDIEAEVVLSIPSGYVRVTRYVCRASFPAHSERRVWFDVVPGRSVERLSEYNMEVFTLDGQRLDRYKTLSMQVSAKDSKAGDEGKGAAEQAPGGMDHTRYLVLRVDSKGVLTAMNLSLDYGSSKRPMAGISCPPEYIPDRYSGLDGFDAVMLGEIDLNEIRPGHLNALKQWVATGGCLAVFPGNRWEEVSGSELEKLLPVRLMGARKANRVSLKGKYDQLELKSRKYVDVWEAEAVAGEVLYSDGVYPMIVRKSYGAGTILFCAFPGTFVPAEQAGTFWGGILRERERVVFDRQTKLSEDEGKILSQLAGGKVVPPKFVALILGIFTLVSAVSLVLFKVIGRMELAWAVIIPSGLLLAYISFQEGRKHRKEVGYSLNAVSVISLESGQTRGLMSGFLGLHSLKESSLDVKASDSSTFITSGRSGEKIGGETIVDRIRVAGNYTLEGKKVIPGAVPTYWLNRYYESSSPVEVDLRFTDKGAKGEVRNKTDQDIKSSMIVSNYFSCRIGDIPAGSTKEFTITAGSVRPRSDFSSKDIERSMDRVFTDVITSLHKPLGPAGYLSWTGQVFLLGWLRGEDIPVEVSGAGGNSIEKRASSLMVLRVVPQPAESGEKVRILRPFVSFSSTSKGVFQLGSALGVFRLPGATELVFRAHPNPAVRNITADAISIGVKLDAWLYNVDVMLLNHKNGEYVRVRRFERPNGKYSVEVENASEYYDPATGYVEVKFEASMSDSQNTQALREKMLSTGWEISGLSVEFEAHSPGGDF